MYSVPFVSATYVLRILDCLFVSTAYQRRTCGVSRVSMAYVLRMCYVRFAAVEYVLGVFCGVPRKYQCFYYMFLFSEVMDQMFLTVRGAVQGSFRATLGVASVFVHVVLRPGWGA